MAIVVLVFWLFTAGAGFYLLVTSSLGRTRPAATAEPTAAAEPAAPAEPAHLAPPTPGAPAAARSATQTAAAAPLPATAPATLSRREQRRAARARWDPPSLTASRKAPMMPGTRSVLEFAHPACAIIGLAFWLGFTLVHNRALGWIAFGLVAVTACAGLTWFALNVRAAKRGDRPAPYFAGRLMVLHGCAAALTITLAALTALVARG
ncbi:MAG TPA: hypothetical protein VGY96_23120 [Streptosporangiaceae bacterium]|jgi:hypothetical protein|nr:hypothetical protein [Streptosporangiaceae bacterium]